MDVGQGERMPQNQFNSYCRLVRLKGDPNKVDEAITLWTKEILAMLKKQKGFGGATLVGNRKSGDGLSVSYWESEATMREAGGHVRPEALKVLSKTGGSIIEDDECEVASLERFKEPKSGVWARVTTVQGDPANVSKAISNFKDTIVPSIQKQSGARTAMFFVNRQTGKALAGSVWDTEQDLRKSEAAIGGLRAEAIEKFGSRNARTDVFEIYVTEILVPAGSAV